MCSRGVFRIFNVLLNKYSLCGLKTPGAFVKLTGNVTRSARMRKVLLLLGLLSFFSAGAQKRFTLSGYIREKGSMETLPGVNVYVQGSTVGTSSNNYGFYSLSIPAGSEVTVIFSYVGYEKTERVFDMTFSREADIELQQAGRLEEVVVSARRQADRVSESVQMSVIEVPVAQIRKIPGFLGEKDVLKVLQLMPGVQKGTEGQSGMYVRGGGPDQNLIILDDATVYNASHLFGFFSVFNGDALKSVELTKGGFPARFGGRLSSVVEMQMKEGNREKLHGEGGIGLLSSRLALDGPLFRKKGSFLVSARRTYIDILARPFIKRAAERDSDTPGGSAVVGYYFYDLNAKANYDLNRRNKLYLSGYFGQDRFYSDVTSPTTNAVDRNKSGLDWGNATGTLRWNHQFSQKLFANTSLIFSNFKFGIDASTSSVNTTSGETEENYALTYYSGIRDIGLKADFDYYPGNRHALRFGLYTTLHRFTPSAIVVSGSFQGDINSRPAPLHSVESALYAEDVWQPVERLKINAGLRLTHFGSAGRQYFRPEPRLSGAYRITKDLSVKASYAIMNQYIHLLSNTGIGLPTDLWVPSTAQVAPQMSEQVAAGLARDLGSTGISLTLEGYYKQMKNIINYKEGASFLHFDGQGAGQNNWENNITSGNGWSYGGEFLLQKKSGRFSGWAGYTLSWTLWQFPELNFGEKFYPRYDRRHDVSLVGIYELSDRVSLSATWVYGTGNALTLPVSTYRGGTDGFFFIGGSLGTERRATEYGGRNSFRAEPYHRLDLAVQFHKKKKKHERAWEFGLYNAYNRRNPFFYQIGSRTAFDEKSQTYYTRNVLERVSLFPVIPSVSYNFKF